ncbi:hypothetical protein BJ165DRAFT_909134 [Panaeolus papilionaceus]|nr:hypothetical protein BJ165DRAFT_909134 [Panaeolus papilionaceus]
MFKLFASLLILAATVASSPTDTLPVGAQCLSYPAGQSKIPCVSGTKCCMMTSVTDTGRCTPVAEGGSCPTRLIGFKGSCKFEFRCCNSVKFRFRFKIQARTHMVILLRYVYHTRKINYLYLMFNIVPRHGKY